jgi:hypothetical protein
LGISPQFSITQSFRAETFSVERLIKRQSELRDDFVPLIEALVSDEAKEIRERARRILDGFSEDV